jgi:hypothetical protein
LLILWGEAEIHSIPNPEGRVAEQWRSHHGDTRNNTAVGARDRQLLAQFREVRVYPLVVLPGDLLDSLGGDFITEDLGRVLASLCGGELDGIQSIIENEDDEWVRDAFIAYVCDIYPAELVQPGFIRLEDVKRDVAMGKNRVLARLADNPMRRMNARSQSADSYNPVSHDNAGIILDEDRIQQSKPAERFSMARPSQVGPMATASRC